MLLGKSGSHLLVFWLSKKQSSHHLFLGMGGIHVLIFFGWFLGCAIGILDL